MLKFNTSCAVLAYLSSNLLNEVGLSLFRYFEVGLRVCDIVVKKFTSAISSPDEFLFYPRTRCSQPYTRHYYTSTNIVNNTVPSVSVVWAHWALRMRSEWAHGCVDSCSSKCRRFVLNSRIRFSRRRPAKRRWSSVWRLWKRKSGTLRNERLDSAVAEFAGCPRVLFWHVLCQHSNRALAAKRPSLRMVGNGKPNRVIVARCKFTVILVIPSRLENNSGLFQEVTQFVR